MNIEVHDTAFMIAHYRAQYEELSRDPYAKLWLRPSVQKWTESFFENVSLEDEVLHCMRNRYFHDELQKLAKKEDEFLFLNLGSGFSMYSYSLPKNVITIEVDLPTIFKYKSQKIETFYAERKLPLRQIQGFSGDITDQNTQEKLIAHIRKLPKRKIVILIEGVFFFLSKPQIDSVLTFCGNLLDKQDLLYCVSYDEEIKRTSVFKKLTTYFEEVLHSEGNPYTVLPHSYYTNLPKFDLVERFSSLELAKQLKCLNTGVKEKEVLNEYFYKLQKE